jgi:hypothetical protein
LSSIKAALLRPSVFSNELRPRHSLKSVRLSSTNGACPTRTRARRTCGRCLGTSATMLGPEIRCDPSPWPRGSGGEGRAHGALPLVERRGTKRAVPPFQTMRRTGRWSRRRTILSTTRAALSGSACSQTRTTVHPAANRIVFVRPSRSTFRAILAIHQRRFAFGGAR